MGLITVAQMVLCGISAIFSAWNGFANVAYGDKDILFPFCSVVFIFYSMLIYLPEAHFKMVRFQLRDFEDELKQSEEQEKLFPLSFFITLVAIVASAAIHALHKYQVVRNCTGNREQQDLVKNKNQSNPPSSLQELQSTETQANRGIIKYFLSLALGLQNASIAYSIALEQQRKLIGSEIFILGLFGLMVNFAYGYLLGWSRVQKNLVMYLSALSTMGLFLGYLLGLFLSENIGILLLPCFCCGLFIYCSSFVCIPCIFSNGQKPIQDKFRYAAIFTALLLSLLYYPFCYLFRI